MQELKKTGLTASCSLAMDQCVQRGEFANPVYV